jgi:hypothetical protein
VKKRSVFVTGLVGLLTVVLMLPILAASVDPIRIPGAAAKSCQQLADQYAPGATWHEVKVTPPSTSGSDGTLSVTLDNLTSLSFDWVADADGPAVDAVYVKSGSQGSNFYHYVNQSYEDTNLIPPRTQSISHILFCYSGIPANQAPVAVDDDYSTPQDTPLTVPAPDVPDVLANDTDDDGDALTAALVTGPTDGSLASGLNADGSFIYTPNAGFTGEDSFTYVANDGTADSNVATVTIQVLPALACGTETDLSAIGQPGYIVLPENGGEGCTKTFSYEASVGTEGEQFVKLIVEGEGPVVFLEYLEFLPQAPNPDSNSLIGLDLYYDDKLDGSDERFAKLCRLDPRVMGDDGPLFELRGEYDSAEGAGAVLPEGETTCVIIAEIVTSADGPLVHAAYYLYNLGDGFRTFR